MIKPTTRQQVAAHIKIAADYRDSSLPLFNNAISQHLLPILGDTLFSALDTAEVPDQDQTTLIDKCRAVIVPFAFAEDMALRNLQLGENGPKVTETDSTRTAHRWEYEKAEEKLMSQGYAAQELLIVYLKANFAKFTDWANSPYNSVDGFAIIRDGNDLRQVTGLEQPHRCYMKLRGLFSVIADTHLKPNISAAYYKALQTRILAGTLSTEEKELLPLLQKATSRMALALAAQEMYIHFGPSGFTVVDKTNDGGDAQRSTAKKQAMFSFAEQQKETARALFEQYIAELNKKASDQVFPEYFASDSYTAPGGNNLIDNKNMQGFVIFS